MSPDGVQALAAGLPQRLDYLHLDFAGINIGADTIRCLAAAIPTRLRVLTLGLHRSGAGIVGARHIAAALPSTLTDACLDFSACGISEEGAEAIADALFRMQGGRLRVLRLGFRGCAVGAVGAKALVQALPECLEHLRINFVGCGVPDDLRTGFLAQRLGALQADGADVAVRYDS